MEPELVLLLFGLISILVGYLRLITDDDGTVDLNSWRFTGCLPAFVTGMVWGTVDLFRLRLSADAVSAVIVFMGVALVILGFKVAQ